jgi:hypothetical protein
MQTRTESPVRESLISMTAHFLNEAQIGDVLALPGATLSLRDRGFYLQRWGFMPVLLFGPEVNSDSIVDKVIRWNLCN